MSSIQKIEGETRIARSESIDEAEESVYAVAKAIDAANESLDDLNESLKIATEKHELYKMKASKAKKLMRRLSTEL